MIQTDIRDDTQDRSDNVRTVQTTAKPDLDNRVIYLLVAEILKSHTGRQLEERRMESSKKERWRSTKSTT